MKRLLRIIEYYGDDEFIEDHIINRAVKGTKVMRLPRGRIGIIKEAILGEVPQLLDKSEQEQIEQLLKKEEDAKNK